MDRADSGRRRGGPRRAHQDFVEAVSIHVGHHGHRAPSLVPVLATEQQGSASLERVLAFEAAAPGAPIAVIVHAIAADLGCIGIHLGILVVAVSVTAGPAVSVLVHVPGIHLAIAVVVHPVADVLRVGIDGGVPVVAV